MRNLKLLNVVSVSNENLATVQHVCWDPDTRTLFCASSTALYCCDPNTRQVEKLACLTDEEYLPRDGSGRIVGMHCHSFTSSVCLATSNGSLLLWHIHRRELECVGMVETGITAMSWSPDLELLVLATGHETLILMNQDFDSITEVTQHPTDLGEAEPVTVGWGRKETQFHGSEGKTAAKRKAEGVKPASAWDDAKPRISWSGDGNFFMVSTINPATGARKLNTWTRECSHHAISEPVDGLEHPLAWRPSSNKAVSTQMRPNSHDVIFFESNGLRHREFSLPFQTNQVKVRELMWNSSGSLLLVWAEEMSGDASSSQPATHVQVWSMGNYHWYLKQTLVFRAQQAVRHLQWDPEQAYTLHLVTGSGQYLQYTWSLATFRSSGHSADDLATVAVIDGSQVLGTPFRKMVVPPPMSAYSLALPCSANSVAFSAAAGTNDMAILLADNTVAIYRTRPSGQSGQKDKNGFRSCCKTPELEGVMRLVFPEGVQESPLCVWHLTWVTPSLMLVCALDSQTSSPVLCTAHLAAQDGEVTIRTRLELEEPVGAIAVSSTTGTVAVQLEFGTILRFDKESETLLPWETQDGKVVAFPCSCPSMDLAVFGKEEVVIGLTDRYQLYINDVQVMRDCTSFAVHDDFLLLTTLKHTLRCVSLHTRVPDLSLISAEKTLPFDESIRRVERGSLLVAAVSCDTHVLLQMPRGNLEGIHPRALVLAAVRRHLDSLEFGKAFRLMKTHRINLNLVYDHNPDAFLSHVKDFILQVETVANINIFLTDLQEDDVTATMYSAAYPPRTSVDSEKEKLSKVDVVCDAVRRTLEELDSDKYLLSVLTTYVKKTVPELEAALKLVQDLKVQGNKAISAEEALKFLLFLVDVNELYDVALGTYDFDLVLMVAEKSQKDPKEYIPFLNGLRRLEENYRKYTIDKHLKRFSRALVHISKCPDHFQECLSLVSAHSLYSAALQLFPVGSSQNQEVAVAYGGHLLERRKPGEAGLMFLRASEWERALDAFVVCLNWRQAFCMASVLKYSPAQTVELALKLAGHLKAQNRHYEAAIVYDQYANDVEEAIATLVEGAHWEEAQRLMHRAGRVDFVETHLLGGLQQGLDQHLGAIADARVELTQHSARLAVVRQLKHQQHLEFLETEGRLNTADGDLFSDTSSAVADSVSSSQTSASNRSSLLSRSSGHSTRSRRKAEQRKWSLKKGSPFEDFALMAALAKLIQRIDSWREEVAALLQALVQFAMDTEAARLQAAYEGLLELVKKLTPDIWKEVPTASSTAQPVFGPGSTANSIAQAMQQGTATQPEEKLDPVLVVPPALRKEVPWKLHTLPPLPQ